MCRRIRRAAVAAAAVTLLTASQAPGEVRPRDQDGTDRAPGLATDGSGDPGAAGALGRRPAPGSRAPGQSDGSYHTELPPLTAAAGPAAPRYAAEVRLQSGLPATVLAAYRRAEASVRRTDPGCRLPWQLLAAIGKVESGHAGGGAVTADGTTRGRILGPVLNGGGFAVITDTDHGVFDGDARYDRAVGPMQFIPSTWASWGADGNGDGRADPDNVFDAALAAGRYLCAGGRDLGLAGPLDQAVLSYNHSAEYLRTVRHWLAFYRTGVHGVPDGHGPVPHSPGAGGDTPATRPADPGGVVIGPAPGGGRPSHPGRPGKPAGPRPTSRPHPTNSPRPPTGSRPSTSPRPSTGPRPTTSPRPTESPSAPGSPGPSTTPGTPSPTDSTGPTDPGTPSTTPPGSPDATPTGSPSPTASGAPGGGPDRNTP
ncbi:lytic murein transglycosylase [Streptomyces sp. LP05-1]|uniref:Lytic murein transglycosylase n=1 Tax=Streptomyces pyxinae TaxID=2970734 RepID=A0ABT2CEC1_9ACTN|nr:lytic murein transglycosylase [Streptomyces sp. LP05-1]MCS0635752.1 lytic murein transglycosylase [Streptomyces sp. LP05-1]